MPGFWKKSLISLSRKAAFSLALLSPSFAFAQEAEEGKDSPALTIGSKAPAIDVEHWVQNGDGKFKPVKKFEKDHVYVVEFWATWCGPCVASMPHLAQLQNDYADKKVQIVSISDEDLDTVTGFLKKPVPGDEEEAAEGAEKKDEEKKTFADLTKAYCLTTDPDGSVYKDYMLAAEQNGIPTAFIVGKDGFVEWIGHPMQMDEPLKSVVDGKWDRATYLAEFKAQQEAQRTMSKVFGLLNRGETDKAMEIIDELIAKTEADASKNQYRAMKFQVILSTGDEGKIEAAGKELFDALKDETEMVNSVAWQIVQMTEAGQINYPKLNAVASAAIEAASGKADEASKGAILDTLAHYQALAGDFDKAIATQKQAIELAEGEIAAQLKEYLKELEAKKKEAAGSKDKDKKSDK